ncbi:SRPBCC family protein [Parasphingorhabdus sp. DH2-15]|uniref:SRPBCC family protein n=1 Tax=Parasphingorhabdus sp. DH2-15 TaxID=3444112 RepID=UPI003F68440A
MNRLYSIARLSVMALTGTAVFAVSPASAEIAKQDDNGFFITHEVDVTTSPDESYEMLRAPAKWWSAQHSWTGDAQNFYMDAQATGCFCELIPASKEGGPRGSVEHMRIVYAEPGKRLRLTGGLGPLQAEAVQGSLTISLKPNANGTTIRFEYVVGGYMRFPVEQIAPAVDTVIGEQVSRLGEVLGVAEEPLIGDDDADFKTPIVEEPAGPPESAEDEGED